jgi:hypothetical protein
MWGKPRAPNIMLTASNLPPKNLASLLRDSGNQDALEAFKAGVEAGLIPSP